MILVFGPQDIAEYAFFQTLERLKLLSSDVRLIYVDYRWQRDV